MMQDPGDSWDGLPTGPQPLLETLLDEEQRRPKRGSAVQEGADGAGGVTILKSMIWIRDRIKRLRHGTGRQA
jgi:hypothetical protein